jgi:nucleoside-diphosphate-sugar epimerase
MNSKPLILITGATGFIGSRTALVALTANYRLRLLVRRTEQISWMKKLFYTYLDSINFVIIPNFTLGFSQALSEDRSGKYDKHIDALKDVDYILHIASPQPGQAGKEKMFEQAVGSTISLMEAAARSGKVRKFVLTASFSTLYPLDGLPEGGIVSGKPFYAVYLQFT